MILERLAQMSGRTSRPADFWGRDGLHSIRIEAFEVSNRRHPLQRGDTLANGVQPRRQLAGINQSVPVRLKSWAIELNKTSYLGKSFRVYPGRWHREPFHRSIQAKGVEFVSNPHFAARTMIPSDWIVGKPDHKVQAGCERMKIGHLKKVVFTDRQRFYRSCLHALEPKLPAN